MTQKKKVLWFYNAITADFSDAFQVKKTYAAGWTSGLFDIMKLSTEFEIIPCFPIKDEWRLAEGEMNGVKYYSVHVGHGELDDSTVVDNTVKVLLRIKPDIVHIWGTEYYFSANLLRACHSYGIESVLVDLQGNISAMAKSLSKGIPTSIYIKKNEGQESIKEHAERLERYAIGEKYILENAHFFCGRTFWDKAYLKQLNKDAIYFHCNRVFRSQFYNEERRWDIDRCVKHRIFVSQAGYSLKGIHYLIRSLPYVIEKYSDSHVFVGGNNSFIVSKNMTSYGEYIEELIVKSNLEDKVTFLGTLNEKEIIDWMLSSNILVSTSIVENNANSICEAMWLGLPVIASFVGGVPSILKDRETGLMFSYDDERMLAGLVDQAFSDKDLIGRISENARQVAINRHSRDIVCNRMIEIYHELL